MSKRAIGYLLIIVAVLDAILSVYDALNAPYPAAVPLGSPMAYLNIYLHVPIAWSTYILYILGVIFAILYLVKRSEKYDRLSALFIYTALVYSFLVLATGSAWAKESWGSYWNWDPRETGVLLLFVAYLVYVAIRKSVADPERRATISAVYAIAAFATVPISFAMPYIMPSSLHPTLANTKSFISHPRVKVLFFSKVLTTVLLSILIPLSIYFGVTRELRIGITVAAIILLIGALIVYPWNVTGRVVKVEFIEKNGGPPIKVYTGNGVKTLKGVLKVTVMSNGIEETVTVNNVKPLPKPEFVPVPGFAKDSNLTVKVDGLKGKYWPTLLGHLVSVQNERVIPQRPFCIAWTLFIYAIGLLFLAYVVKF